MARKQDQTLPNIDPVLLDKIEDILAKGSSNRLAKKGGIVVDQAIEIYKFIYFNYIEPQLERMAEEEAKRNTVTAPGGAGGIFETVPPVKI